MSIMKSLAKQLNADKLVLKTAQLYDFENGHPLMPENTNYNRYKLLENGTFARKGKMPNRCFRLWSGSVITATGAVVPCCFDKDAMHAFGNINSGSFQAIYHNSNATEFRNSILSNRKQYAMCRNCTSR
jgi:radical SAM protein with 4Fe4S-binding SPASM domain